MAALETKNFTLTYSSMSSYGSMSSPDALSPVFPPLNLRVEEGETVAIKGDSGAGKSSLLLCACGLIPGSIPAQTQGELLLYGRPPAAYSRAELTGLVGMVFQNPETQLFCGTLELEVAFGLENLCVPQEEMHVRVREALELVGLWERRGDSPEKLSEPAKLSGGQKQLLALAAVLVLRPKLLLLDEALSQLDAEASERMMSVLRGLQNAGQTMLIVDHDDKRRSFAHREICL